MPWGTVCVTGTCTKWKICHSVAVRDFDFVNLSAQMSENIHAKNANKDQVVDSRTLNAPRLRRRNAISFCEISVLQFRGLNKSDTTTYT